MDEWRDFSVPAGPRAASWLMKGHAQNRQNGSKAPDRNPPAVPAAWQTLVVAKGCNFPMRSWLAVRKCPIPLNP